MKIRSILLICLLCTFCLAQDKHSVRVAKVKSTEITSQNSYPGTVHPCEKTQLSFRISGPLVSVNVKPGDIVEKGQLLMQVDNRDYEDSIAVLEAELSKATAQQLKSKLDFDRANTLYQQKVTLKADYDTAKNNYDISLSTIKSIEAQLAIAKHKLDDTTLRAHYAGIITEQLVENFEMIQTGQIVLKMQDISKLEIDINVPENEIVNYTLKAGQPATVKFPSVIQRQFPTNLKEWSTEASNRSRTYKLTFVMNREKGIGLLPGMTAELSFEDIGTARSVITVPAGAIFETTLGKSAVWLYDTNTKKITKRLITSSGLNGSSDVIVESGLKGGETIVIEGVDFVNTNTELEVINTPEESRIVCNMEAK